MAISQGINSRSTPIAAPSTKSKGASTELAEDDPFKYYPGFDANPEAKQVYQELLQQGVDPQTALWRVEVAKETAKNAATGLPGVGGFNVSLRDIALDENNIAFTGSRRPNDHIDNVKNLAYRNMQAAMDQSLKGREQKESEDLRSRLVKIAQGSTDPTQSKSIIEEALQARLAKQQAVAKMQTGKDPGALARRLSFMQGIAKQESAQDLAIASAQERQINEQRRSAAQQMLLGNLQGERAEEAKRFAIDTGSSITAANLASEIARRRSESDQRLVGSIASAGGQVAAAQIKGGSNPDYTPKLEGSKTTTDQYEDNPYARLS